MAFTVAFTVMLAPVLRGQTCELSAAAPIGCVARLDGHDRNPERAAQVDLGAFAAASNRGMLEGKGHSRTERPASTTRATPGDHAIRADHAIQVDQGMSSMTARTL